MIEELTFLEAGEYTKITDFIKGVVTDLKKSKRTPFGAISEYLISLKYNDSDKENIFRKRTASEILASGFVTGCTDTALAFIVLARAQGIPTKYVETFHPDFFKNKSIDKVEGHIFVDVLVNEKWRAIDPKQGFLKNNAYVRNGKTYVLVGKGLDFSEVYLIENGVYQKKPTNIKHFDKKTLDDVIRTVNGNILPSKVF